MESHPLKAVLDRAESHPAEAALPHAPCVAAQTAAPQNSLNETCHGEVEPAHGLVRVVAWRSLPSLFHESVLRRAYICSGNWAHRVSPGFTAPLGKSAVWSGCFSLVAALYGEAATVPLPVPLP